MKQPQNYVPLHGTAASPQIPNKPCSFTLWFGPDKKWIFEASSLDESKQWIKLLGHVIGTWHGTAGAIAKAASVPLEFDLSDPASVSDSTWIESIIMFWFFGKDEPSVLSDNRAPQLWFYRNPILDNLIKTNFLPIWEKAVRGECDSWAETNRGALALVLLLDQFSRNMFRDTARMFEGDKKALEIAEKVTSQKLEQNMPLHHRNWFYFVFTRPEDVQMLKKAKEHFEQFITQSGWSGTGAKKFVERQLTTLIQFGRFPHRNAILGRKSTKEEEKFLSEGDRLGT